MRRPSLTKSVIKGLDKIYELAYADVQSGVENDFYDCKNDLENAFQWMRDIQKYYRLKDQHKNVVLVDSKEG